MLGDDTAAIPRHAAANRCSKIELPDGFGRFAGNAGVRIEPHSLAGNIHQVVEKELAIDVVHDQPA